MTVKPSDKLRLIVGAGKRPELYLVWITANEGRLTIVREFEAGQLAG